MVKSTRHYLFCYGQLSISLMLSTTKLNDDFKSDVINPSGSLASRLSTWLRVAVFGTQLKFIEKITIDIQLLRGPFCMHLKFPA